MEFQMRKLLIATAVVGAAAVSLPAAYAIDVVVGGDGEVDVTIGVGAGEEGAEAGAAAGAEAGAGAVAGGGEAGAMMEPPAEIMLRTDGDAEMAVAAEALVAQSVFTNDGVEIGTVTAVSAAANGDTQLIIALNEGWMEGVNSVAISSSVMMQTDGQLVVNTDEADLRSSIEAGMAAAAEAG